MYDWANSAFVTIVMAAVFPVYFGKVANAGFDSSAITARLAAVNALAILINAVAAPVLGALADRRPIKKKLLAVFMLLGASSTAGMFFITEGRWMLACGLLLAANVGAAGSFVFYNALLPHIATDDETDRVSAGGFALGYIGGGLALLISLAIILKPDLVGIPRGTLPSRIVFLFTAAWWALFTLPLLLKVPEPAIAPAHGGSKPLNAVRQVFRTLAELRTYRGAFLLLCAFLIYNDGIQTIIRMAANYGATLRFSDTAIIGSLLITQFVGFPCAFAFGMLAGRIGTRQAITLGVLTYVGVAVLGFFMTREWHFLALAVMVGLVQGGTQALSRSLFARLIPRHKSGQFFGFFGIMDRFSGMLGSGLIAGMAAAGGEPRVGILSIAAFFLVGAVVLQNVREQPAR